MTEGATVAVTHRCPSCTVQRAEFAIAVTSFASWNESTLGAFPDGFPKVSAEDADESSSGTFCVQKL